MGRPASYWRKHRRARTLASFTRTIQHAAMRPPEVSADPDARRKWRNERKRARKAAAL